LERVSLICTPFMLTFGLRPHVDFLYQYPKISRELGTALPALVMPDGTTGDYLPIFRAFTDPVLTDLGAQGSWSSIAHKGFLRQWHNLILTILVRGVVVRWSWYFEIVYWLRSSWFYPPMPIPCAVAILVLMVQFSLLIMASNFTQLLTPGNVPRPAPQPKPSLIFPLSNKSGRSLSVSKSCLKGFWVGFRTLASPVLDQQKLSDGATTSLYPILCLVVFHFCFIPLSLCVYLIVLSFLFCLVLFHSCFILLFGSVLYVFQGVASSDRRIKQMWKRARQGNKTAITQNQQRNETGMKQNQTEEWNIYKIEPDRRLKQLWNRHRQGNETAMK